MTFERLVWLVGGAGSIALAGAASVVGCSSSSNGGTTPDSGTTTMQDSAAPEDAARGNDAGTTEGTDSGTTSVDSGTSTGDSGTCENPPKLYAETTPGVYCPFSAADGGGTQTCAPGQHCCETPSGSTQPSTCVADGTACPVAGSVDWQCEAPIDCLALDAGTPVCCGTGSPTTASSCGQTWAEWNNFTGTKCMAACPSPGITVCEQGSDCTTDAGTTCTPSKSNGNDFGFCN